MTQGNDQEKLAQHLGKVEYHKWLKDDTVKVKLMKMSKGFQWEITYEGEDYMAVLDRIDIVNRVLKERYAGDGEATS